jgi:hypothetical protein
MNVQGMECCGASEFTGLNDVEFSVKGVLREIGEECSFGHNEQPGKGAIYFSVAYDDENSHPAGWVEEERNKPTVLARYNNLANYIVNHGLGDWFDVPPYNNPNHATWIKCGFWTINQPAFAAWYRKDWDKLNPNARVEGNNWYIEDDDDVAVYGG